MTTRITVDHPVGSEAEFPAGTCKIVNVEGREIGIVRMPDGEFRAVRNVCPHKGAPICRGIVGGTWAPSAPGELIYDRDGEVLVCPWHGYEYDLKTGVELYQAKPTKLLMYRATVKDGQVVVSL